VTRQTTVTVVEGENLPPVPAAVSERTVDEGKPLKLIVQAEDPEGQPVSWSAGDVPDGGTFSDKRNGSGLLTWTPRFDQAGRYAVTVTASDGVVSSSRQIRITVRKKSLAISGTVLDDATRRRVDGAVVQVEQGNRTIGRVVSDADGFYLVNDLAPGVYRVEPRYEMERPVIMGTTVSVKDMLRKFSPPFSKVTMSEDQDKTGVNFLASQ
jgi:hypothetical protein